MLGRALLEQLADRGDLLGMPRQIDHLALFELRSEAEQAGGELTGRAFRVRSVSQREDGSWALAFERDESLDDQQADVFVAEILDVVLPHNGRYDGWGCLVIKGSMQ